MTDRETIFTPPRSTQSHLWYAQPTPAAPAPARLPRPRPPVGPEFVVRLRAQHDERDPDASQRLRRALKYLGRAFGMRCIGVESPDASPAPRNSDMARPSDADHPRDHPATGAPEAIVSAVANGLKRRAAPSSLTGESPVTEQSPTASPAPPSEVSP